MVVGRENDEVTLLDYVYSQLILYLYSLILFIKCY